MSKISLEVLPCIVCGCGDTLLVYLWEQENRADLNFIGNVAQLYVSLIYKRDQRYSEQSSFLSQLWNAKLITGGINLELELFWWKSSLAVWFF